MQTIVLMPFPTRTEHIYYVFVSHSSESEWRSPLLNYRRCKLNVWTFVCNDYSDANQCWMSTLTDFIWALPVTWLCIALNYWITCGLSARAVSIQALNTLMNTVRTQLNACIRSPYFINSSSALSCLFVVTHSKLYLVGFCVPHAVVEIVIINFLYQLEHFNAIFCFTSPFLSSALKEVYHCTWYV